MIKRQIKTGKVMRSAFLMLMLLAFSGYILTVVLCSAVSPVSATGDTGLGVNISAPDVIKSGGYYILVEHNESTNLNLENFDAFGFYGYSNDDLTVYTNSPAGYQLYISSDQDSNFSGVDTPSSTGSIPGNALFLDGELGNSEYFAPTTGTFTSPSTSLASGETATGTTSAALSGNNSWGFSLSQNDTYAGIPLKNNETLIKVHRGDNSALADTDPSVAQSVYYGAKASLSKAAGTYSGSVLYTAMSDADSTLDGVATISPDSTENLAGGDEVTIRTSLFTNMADLGEMAVYIGNYSSTSDTPVAADACTNVSGAIDTEDNNNLVITCDTPAKSAGTYDVLVLVEKFDKAYLISDAFTYGAAIPAFWQISTMQEMTPEICNSVHTPTNATALTTPAAVMIDKNAALNGQYADVTSDNTSPKVAQHTLSDIRDGKTYTVRKLADGNCWMASNLQFELEANKTYTGVDNTTGNTITFNTGAACATNGACIMNGNTAENTDTSSEWYGEWYYSWYAATAGSGTESMTTDSGDTQNSICPAHWRLPTNYTNKQHPSGGADKSWGYLVNAYGISPENHASDTEYRTLEAFPFTLPRAGFFSSGAFQNNGYGYWWSATAHSTATYAYNLLFSTTLVYPQYGSSYGYKYNGCNVRCVAV